MKSIWMFPKIGGKPPKWMVKIMEHPIKVDDLGVPLFLETPIFPMEKICPECPKPTKQAIDMPKWNNISPTEISLK